MEIKKGAICIVPTTIIDKLKIQNVNVKIVIIKRNCAQKRER